MDRRKWVFDNLVALSKIENGKYVLFDKLPKRILVWGTGKYGESVACILEELHISPLAFLDSNERKHGGRFHSIKILDPLIALEEYKDACILLAMSSANATEPKKILKCLARNYMDIWEFILCGLNKSISILEIGPLYCPMFKGDNVKYLDVYDVPKLREIAKSLNASDEDVPKKIDYVSPNGDWCNINESFNIIYSSHVIEHQTDLIQHFTDVFSHIRSGGGICACDS